MDISDLSETIKPKSNQLNNEQLIGGPLTIKITGIERVEDEQQPLLVHYEGESGRPYKPSKTFRKVILALWGKDGNKYIGQSMTLFRNPETCFGKEKTGGIEISHMTGLDCAKVVVVTKTRGKMREITVRPLEITPTTTAVTADEIRIAKDALKEAASIGKETLVTVWKSIAAPIRAAGFPDGCPQEYKDTASAADAAKGGE